MVIKALLVGGAAFVALSSNVALAQAPVEGNYAAAAIVSGQLNEAERALQPSSQADAGDPARLINIATVYSRTQRFAEARTALSQVQALPAEQLELANGQSYSSHIIAKAMLQRLGQ